MRLLAIAIGSILLSISARPSDPTPLMKLVFDYKDSAERARLWSSCASLSSNEVKALLSIIRNAPVTHTEDNAIPYKVQNGRAFEDKHIALLLLGLVKNRLGSSDIDVLIENIDYKVRQFGSGSITFLSDDYPAFAALINQGDEGMDALVRKLALTPYPDKIHALGRQVLERYYGFDMMIIKLDYELDKLKDEKHDKRYVNLHRFTEHIISSKVNRSRLLDRYLSR